MYVSIMERKGIEKGIQLGRTEGIQLGEARGIQLGRTECIQLGEARGIASTARRMLEGGLPMEQIAEFTGLSLKQIEALRHS